MLFKMLPPHQPKSHTLHVISPSFRIAGSLPVFSNIDTSVESRVDGLETISQSGFTYLFPHYYIQIQHFLFFIRLLHQIMTLIKHF